MASKHRSTKQESPEIKTRAGKRATNKLKSSSFLPGVFQTELNKKWLDSTLDQMLSKGDLQDIDAFIGSQAGKHRAAKDQYLDTNRFENDMDIQLSPTAVSDDGDNVRVMSFDDVVKSNNIMFDSYNYNSAYATNTYTYAPPIDVDKFINYELYLWMPDMPVYESVVSTAIDMNQIIGRPTYTWSDDNNTFDLQNGQRIKLTGAGIPAEFLNCTYMVEGVGHGIKFVQIRDAEGRLTYAFQTIRSPITITGIWDYEDANGNVVEWDSSAWDFNALNVKIVEFNKDYLVINRADHQHTAWSRNNNWVHEDTVNEWFDLLGLDYKKHVFYEDRRALRPIIEFNAGISKHNSGTTGHLGNIVAIVDQETDVNLTLTGKVFVKSTGFVVDVSNGVMTPEYMPVDGNTAVLWFAIGSSFDSIHNYVDIVFRNGEWTLAQQKEKFNQAPLFMLKTADNEIRCLGQITSKFKGSRIFGYKEAESGLVDPELHFVPVRKDSDIGADFVFENFIHTERYTDTQGITAESGITQEEITGLYFYEQDGDLYSTYRPIQRATSTLVREQIVSDGGAVEFSTGSDAWTEEKTFTFVENGDSFTVVENTTSGHQCNYKQPNPALYLETGKAYKFINLVPDTRVAVYMLGDTPAYATAISGREFFYTLNTAEQNMRYAIIDSSDNVIGKSSPVYAVTSQSILKQQLRINGEVIADQDYTVTADTTTVPADLLKEDDIVDLEYYSKSGDINSIVPGVIGNNPTNSIIGEFTQRETISHWMDLIDNAIAVEGESHGRNTYHKCVKEIARGGNIMLHDGLGIAHNLALGYEELSIGQALADQGRDWWAFKQRVIGQAKRIWATQPVMSVHELTTKVLDAVMANRKGSPLYKHSNMLFNRSNRVEEFDCTTDTSFTVSFVANSDRTVRDHVYVYMTDDHAGTGNAVKHILSEGMDYTLNGSNIELLATPVVTPEVTMAKLEVHYHRMDDESQVPQSMTKLYMNMLVEPQMESSIDGKYKLICHDGSELVYDGTAPTNTEAFLYDVKSPEFNPEFAVLMDIEKRVFTGMVKGVKTTSPYSYYNSVGRNTWYDNNLHIEDDHMFKAFVQYARFNNIDIEMPVPVLEDPFTWNYSHGDAGGYLKSQLPGYWRNAYIVLFDTDMPHIAPWHMLGMMCKPAWWDTHYSWTDLAKRADLITALENGMISEPGTPVVTDERYARFNWDWTDRCPVDETGALRMPADVLIADPAYRVFDVYTSQPYEFNDGSEQQIAWRKSAQGQAALLDVVINLMPVQAWTDFFIADQNYLHVHSGFTLDRDTRLPVNMDLHYAGDATGYRLADIEVTTTDFIPDSDIITNGVNALVINGYSDVHGQVTAHVDASDRVNSISIEDRGYNYEDTPILKFYDDNGVEVFVGYKIKMANSNVITSGLDQLLTNSYARAQKQLDNNLIFGNIDAQLAQKMGGYSAKHLLRFFAESSASGLVNINDSDYELVMYKSTPRELLSITSLEIEKTVAGKYRITGFSPNKQQFSFYEPDVTNPTAYTDVPVNNGATTVRRYNKFSALVSVADYGVEFNKIQDVYNFIRGYYAFMEDQNYKLTTEYDVIAQQTASALITTDAGETIYMSIGNEVTYTAEHGSVVEVNTMPKQANSVVNLSGKTVSTSDMTVTRSDDSVTITLDDQPIGAVSFAVVEYEHMAIFDNVTSFNRTIFDSATNMRFPRLKVVGQRTKDWRGERDAPGFLVFDNKIVQNWDSSVDQVRDFYDHNVTKFNDGIESAERLTNGNISRDWVNTFNLSQNTVNEFYNGVLKEKGTNATIDRLQRAKIVNNGISEVSHDEVWMFRNHLMGDVTNFDATEFHLLQSEVNNSVQQLKFVENLSDNTDRGSVTIAKASNAYDSNPRYINGDTPSFETMSWSERKQAYKLRTSGDPLLGDTDFIVDRVSDIPSIFADMKGTDIETWNSRESYKRGTQVRHKGKLYECDVEFTGLNLVGTNIVVTGTNRYPTMPSGSYVLVRSNATNSYTYVDFGGQTAVTNPIIAIGTETDPVVQSEDGIGLSIDGVFINLENKEQVLEDNQYPTSNPGAYIPTIENTLVDTTIEVNGVTVDFSEPNAPSFGVETFEGTGSQNTFFLTQPLGTYTTNPVFSVEVNQVRINGALQTAGVDYVINEGNSSVTFATAPLGEITHTEYNDVPSGTNSTSETISVNDTDLSYTLSTADIETITSVTVDSVTQVYGTDFTISGNTITFTNNFVGTETVIVNIEVTNYIQVPYEVVDQEADEITVTLIPTNTKSYTEIKTRIESTVNNVLVYLDSNNLFRIRGTIPGNGQSLVIGTGSANDELGLIADTYYGGSQLVYVHTALDLDGVINRINSTSTPGVQASNLNDALQITSTNTLMTLGGTTSAIDALGLIAGQYTASTSNVVSPDTVDTIALKINQALEGSDNELSVSNIDGYLTITGSEGYIEIVGTEFNDIVGFTTTDVIESGTYVDQEVALYSSETESVENDFIESEWTDITYSDPSLSSVWVMDDSEFEYSALNGVKVRNGGWNVYRFMDFGFYAEDEDCCICAGTVTTDGNDAEIKIANSDHNVQPGDYVMILNSTSKPSVDGIHKVTRVNQADPSKFYIDMYIEECGQAPTVKIMRSVRFTSEQEARDSMLDTANYRYYTDYLLYSTEDDNTGVGQESRVLRATANTQPQFVSTTAVIHRILNTRVTNADVDHITIYDGDDVTSAIELEMYDPVMGIIPGIADREIDIKSPVDFAKYSDSTDITFESNADLAWGKEQVGKTWWDTGACVYYDYGTDTAETASRVESTWGMKIVGDIVVYEWIRSSVPPEEWAKAVEEEKTVYGVTATGEAYSVFDPTLREDVYYYTETSEWNSNARQNTPVYYFWVKNKTTIEQPARRLTVSQLAAIIDNPTTAGISWFASTGENSMIVANVTPYLTDSTVAQINRTLSGTAHTSWTAIRETNDNIPLYWYEGARDNLVGYLMEDMNNPVAPAWDSATAYLVGAAVNVNNINYTCIKDVTVGDSFTVQRIKGCWVVQDNFLLKQRLPEPKLHKFNRYGDNREIGQGWFKDLFGARREFIAVANRFIKEINLLDEMPETWDRRLSTIQDVWEWTTYVSPERSTILYPSLEVDRPSDLDSVNTEEHQLVRVKRWDSEYRIDRSELHQWTGTEWNMVEKNNATIQFNDFLWNTARLAAWDNADWDNYGWDSDKNYAMYLIVEAVRYDILIGQYKKLFNTLWFKVIDYVISEHDYVDWLYKTTYITVNIETPLDTTARRYTRNNIDNVLGYINTVKPFHTKIKEVFDVSAVNETLALSVEEVDSGIAVVIGFPDGNDPYPSGEYIRDIPDGEYAGDIYVGGAFESETIMPTLGDWLRDPVDTLQGGSFIEPGRYNFDGHSSRNQVYSLDAEESLAIEVIRNVSGSTVDNDTSSIVYLRDNVLNTLVYRMPAISSTSIVGDITEQDTNLVVLDATPVQSTGFAYIAGEIIEYGQTAGPLLMYIKRGQLGTRAKAHADGTPIVFLDDNELESIKARLDSNYLPENDIYANTINF